MHGGTLGNWVHAWRREYPEPNQSLTPVERTRVKELEDENRRLRMENEFLKRPRPSSRGRRSSRALCVDRSGEGQLQDCLDMWAVRYAQIEFYAWRNRVETATQTRRRELAVEVVGVFGVSRQAFGCRRIVAALGRDGIECSVGLVLCVDVRRCMGPWQGNR